MKVTSLKAGMQLYDVRGRDRWDGMPRFFSVQIVEVFPDGSFSARWNGNSERKYSRGVPSSWRLKRPEPKRGPA